MSSVTMTGRVRTFRPPTSADEVTLYEVKAERDLPQHGVSAGDVGGWVESLYLPDGSPRISGDAWLGPGAEMYDEARIDGNAFVSGRAVLRDRAHVTDDAVIRASNLSPHTRVSVRDDAVVSGRAHVVNGLISESARVTGDATVQRGTVSGGAVVSGGTVALDAEVTDSARLEGGYLAGGALTGDSVMQAEQELPV